ncbi:hypothetical protein T235_06595 [Tannerella sp. oral taxon BU063 isolate Cell 8/11]|uniref:Uncharacterized protein n=1 Tax=Tannerella sp. oral taxon BU063 isolate Cell 8/11 TaxID=1411915 RepID=W2D291_9BACT|nr:hypothetical protein T235_06595 [Tannerella sp. oral taxon BU063 isolate Cell 8/11]
MRRETDQNLRKVTFCDGKRGKFFEKSFPAAGRRLKVSEIGFARREKGAYSIRPQNVSNGNDFAYPYK